jgi:UDP:flavonoid glycosyltransferase YjiC (YdhE family)
MSSHIHFIGPLLPYARQKNAAPWYHPKLVQYDKVILVTQGTVEKDYEKIIVPTLDAFSNTSYLVVVTTGGSGTEELRKKYAFDNIIIEDFIPFNDIMPYADVYITNGGYGGVLLSIQNRLPLVVAGVHEGKNEINARVGYFKLGINLDTEKPSAKQIKKSVEKIFRSSVYAANVEKLSEEFNRYDPLQLCEKHAARLLRQASRPKMYRAEPEFIY